MSYDPEKRPAVSNLVTIYSSLGNITIEDVCSQFKDAKNTKFKEALTELMIEKARQCICCFNRFKVVPIGNETKRLLKDERHINSILEEGGNYAKQIASENLKQIKKVVGFL